MIFRRRAAAAPVGVPLRWIALDLETTGLDPERDRIIELGGVAITHGVIDLADSLHRVVADSGKVSADNRLVHGITAAEQYEGASLPEALDALLAWRQGSPLVGFHTRFDVGFIGSALKRLGQREAARDFARHFIDLAVIAPVVFKDVPARGLKDWSRALKLPIRKQHRATADALATAHLLQKVLAALPPEQRSFEALEAMAAARRWL